MNPTATLEQELKKFEAILSIDQKRQYQTSTSRPDASSVVAFVAQIDNSNKSRANRCVAPRLCNFLDATQQFTSVVDTFISSNPNVAALVWGGVKVTVLAASNIASYFDKVTHMIMNIGKTCPTYRQFGQLYPDCLELQHALCDFYAKIVRLCIKIVETSRRTAIGQALSSILNPFEMEFKDVQNEIKLASQVVQSQVSLASKQAAQESARLLEMESKENKKQRRLDLTFYTESRKEHAKAQEWRIRRAKREVEKLRFAIRTTLSTIDYTRPWQRAVKQRLPETAEWFQREESFCQWRSDKQTATLWCSGTIGVGKTILLANIVSKLHAEKSESEVIAYYFCQPGFVESLRARTILGSIAYQLLANRIAHAEEDILLKLHQDCRGLDAADVIDFINPYLEAEILYSIVLDGLEECEKAEVHEVSRALSKLCNMRAKGVKILCSGRPEMEKKILQTQKPRYKLAFTKGHSEADIQQYVTTVLDDCLGTGQLKLTDPSLVLTIADAVPKGSDGMFLWARLVIEEICAMGCDNDIKVALKNLPKELYELFNRKIARQENSPNAKEATKVLQWCGISRRPLTTEELREALSVSPEQKWLDRGSLPHEMDGIFTDCCGLIFVDEEWDTVHYVHQSVRKHLYSGHFDEKEVDINFAHTCMTYLNFNDFKRQVAKVKKDFGPLPNPMEIGIGAITHPTSITSRLAQRLLRESRSPRRLNAEDLERHFQELSGPSHDFQSPEDAHNRQFPFLDYSQTYWIYHTTHINDTKHKETWKLFCKCINDGDHVAHRPWIYAECEQRTIHDLVRDVIEWSLKHKNDALLRYHFLYNPEIISSSIIEDILVYVVAEDRPQDFLLLTCELPISYEVLMIRFERTIVKGSVKLLSPLLAAGAKVNEPFRQPKGLDAGEMLFVRKRMPLEAAAEAGRLDVVELLLAAGAKINERVTSFYNQQGPTALEVAARKGYTDVVRALLNAARAYDKRDIHRRPLLAAIKEGHTEVVDLLLQGGADVNADNTGQAIFEYDDIMGQPIFAAVRKGNLEILKKIINYGAKINVKSRIRYSTPEGKERIQCTPLLAAVLEGKMEIVDLLLSVGADVNAKTEYPPIVLAAREGHQEIARKLLNFGAAVDAKSEFSRDRGQTALHMAVKYGHLKVVKDLVEVAGADPNAADADGNTPLELALKNIIRQKFSQSLGTLEPDEVQKLELAIVAECLEPDHQYDRYYHVRHPRTDRWLRVRQDLYEVITRALLAAGAK